MNKDTINVIINTLKNQNPEVIGIFGSYSRNETIIGSDIDILVRFKSILSRPQLVHAENLIPEKPGIKVELVTEGAMKNQKAKDNIQRDLQIMYH